MGMFNKQDKPIWTPEEKAALDEIQRQLIAELRLKKESFGLVEPDVWFELCRMRSTLTCYEMNKLIPDEITVRCFFDEKTGWQIWEYLM